jgi:hypothetical protein
VVGDARSYRGRDLDEVSPRSEKELRGAIAHVRVTPATGQA